MHLILTSIASTTGIASTAGIVNTAGIASIVDIVGNASAVIASGTVACPTTATDIAYIASTYS